MKFNEKHSFKKALVCTLVAMAALNISCGNINSVKAVASDNSETSSVSNSTNEENQKSGEFDFIKSENHDNNLLYNSKFLLYGGITLIVISVTGMATTIVYKGKRKKLKNKKRVQINKK